MSSWQGEQPILWDRPDKIASHAGADGEVVREVARRSQCIDGTAPSATRGFPCEPGADFIPELSGVPDELSSAAASAEEHWCGAWSYGGGARTCSQGPQSQLTQVSSRDTEEAVCGREGQAWPK